MKKQTSILRTLTGRSFRANRARNIVAVIAVALTTLMFTTLFVLAQSMQKNMIEMTFRQTGYDAQASFKNITEEQAERIAAHPDVEELGQSIVLGLAENKSLAGKQVEIRWGNDSYASHSFALPTTGSMPQTADEIALDTLTLDRLGIPHEIGADVTLEWRKDLSQEEKTNGSFTLCGYWEGNESSYASMAWVSRSFADEMTAGQTPSEDQILGLHMAQVSLPSDSNIEASMDKILADTQLSQLEYGVNLAYSPEMNATAVQESIPMYLGMILVFVAGYLIIYNIFQISVAADIQFYGKLKTLGTTTKQIRRILYGQANRLCLIGIPAGLVFGFLLGMVLVPVLMGTFGGSAVTSAHPAIFLGSALFAWATVLISCLRPARLAGKVSPMEALRYNDSDSKSKKKTKKGRKGASLTGMAWANLGRNKKRTVTVICSLTLGLVLLSCFYAKNASFDMEKYLSGQTIADFELADISHEDAVNGYNPQGNTLNNELTADVEALEGLEALGHMYSHQLSWEMDAQTIENLNAFYTQDMLDDWSTYDPTGPKALKAAIADKRADTVIYGLDGIPLDTITQSQYLYSGTYDAETFATGNYVLAIGPAIDESEKEKYKVYPTPSVGDSIIIEEKNYTVMGIVYPLNSVDSGAMENGGGSGFSLSFILHSDAFCRQWPDNTLRKLFFNIEDSHLNDARKVLNEYTKNMDASLPVTSRQTMIEQYQAETRASAVMGNAISLVIALVGILNFINSMVTAIVSRKKEFAMIQSVGMTKRQLCRMLIYEGLYYAVITIGVSFLVSAFAVGIGVRAMVEGGYSTFRFTLLPLGICIPVLLGFAVLVPLLCFRNLEKQSIVERLRAID
ncbi:ABC transporter permease [Lactonifactor longoviformis]|uniref:Putative ABC transport system permease protein n=1 Tax=Lactonifactor longoviformis DSM 17459 TaxID=1122155 RepID=A0A1M4VKW6_9CLOT|nr:ABC transporter permease [Lactonifactor longoviformis]POP34183.1 ABC transporter permease [Lactonifactor longoviformis]SHE69706.1 putative ABC transport system permease protein [Lactonifactor longoviformis DSM 17459]